MEQNRFIKNREPGDLPMVEYLWRHLIDLTHIAAVLPEAVESLHNEFIQGTYDDLRSCYKEYLPFYNRLIARRIKALKVVLLTNPRFVINTEQQKTIEEYAAMPVFSWTSEDWDEEDDDFNMPVRPVIRVEDFAKSLTEAIDNDYDFDDREFYNEVNRILFPEIPDNGLGGLNDVFMPYENIIGEITESVIRRYQLNTDPETSNETDDPWDITDYEHTLVYFLRLKASEDKNFLSFTPFPLLTYPGLPAFGNGEGENPLGCEYTIHETLREFSDDESSSSSDDDGESAIYRSLPIKRQRGQRRMVPPRRTPRRVVRA